MDSKATSGFRLSWQIGERPASRHFDQAEVTIGRASECDVVLAVPGVSRQHAAIRRETAGWRLVDLQSRNGTFVNDRRVEQCPLSDGDRISPGPENQFPVTLTFRSEGAGSSDKDLVVVEDRADGGTIGLTINVEDYARLADDQAGTLAAIGDAARGRRPGPPVIRLFKQLGEALLLSRSLEEMLDRVVDLVLAHLPVSRALVCLCDPSGENLRLVAAGPHGASGGKHLTLSRSIVGAAIQSRQAVLVTDAAADARFSDSESIRSLAIRGAMCAPLYHAGKVQGLIYVDTDQPGVAFTAGDLELLTATGAMTAVGIQQARLREAVTRERAVRDRLSRYHSPAVVEQIAARAVGPEGEMAAEQCEVSVLFGDLCGFTPLASTMSPPDLAGLLNAVFEQLTHAIFLYGGTLDKYVGDAVMAIFGAPLVQPNHAERAIRAALRMQELLDEFNAARPASERLRIRVGINSGTAVCGDIGSQVQKGYTVIGDVVNVASRLESSVAQAGQVVIGPSTYELVREAFECSPLGDARLRGKQEPIRPYLVLGPLGDATLGLADTV